MTTRVVGGPTSHTLSLVRALDDVTRQECAQMTAEGRTWLELEASHVDMKEKSKQQ